MRSVFFLRYYNLGKAASLITFSCASAMYRSGLHHIAPYGLAILYKTHISLNCFYFQSHNCLLKFLVKHKIFFVFRFRLPKGSPAPHFFTASGGKIFLSSRKIFRPAQAPLRLSSSDNAKVRIFHHPCKYFAQKQHFFHPYFAPNFARN